MILIVPVGRTRSRSCACNRPLYCKIRSTNGRSLPRGMKRAMPFGRERVLSGATALAVVILGCGEEVCDVAVHLRGGRGGAVGARRPLVRARLLNEAAA